MSLSNRQIEIIQSATPIIAANADAVAETFYGFLFEFDPTLRPMFRGDMKEQGRKLMQMLSVALVNVGNLDSLDGPLNALGSRHVGYGVTADHYNTVGQALITTLSTMLGESFTAEAQDAWVTLYTTLVNKVTADLYELQLN
ncbi:MAG: hemin receptor [Chloroflexi bacterium]|nr:hemin receptor [Chloroflexota bacterium]